MLALTLATLQATALQTPRLLEQAPAPPFASTQIHAESDQVFARGPGYRARFDAGGATFEPALGSAEPSAQPFAFGTDWELLRGDEAVASGNSLGLPTRAVAGNEITYELSEGLAESFRVERAGLEHTLHLESEPEGSGSLVLRRRIQTDLLLAPDFSSERLRFRSPHGEGTCGLDVWGVVGIDAEGRRSEGWLDFDGEWLSIGLPEAFVESAAYPLALDPWITPVTPVATSAERVDDVLVSYNGSLDQNLFLWREEFGFNDSDLLAQRVDSNGSPVGSLIVVEGSLELTTNSLQLSSAIGESAWLLAYTQPIPAFFAQEVQCRAIDGTGVVGDPVTLTATGFMSQVFPIELSDAALDGRFLCKTGRADPSPTVQTTVFRLDLALPPGGPPTVTLIEITPSNNNSSFQERFAEGPPFQDGWLTTRLSRDPSTGIVSLLVNVEGKDDFLDSAFLDNTSFSSPIIAGSQGSYLVTYGRSSADGVFTRPVRWDGVSVEIGEEQLVAATGAPQQLAFTGEAYVLLFGESGVTSAQVLDAITGSPQGPAIVEPAPFGLSGITARFGDTTVDTDRLTACGSLVNGDEVLSIDLATPGDVEPLGGGCGTAGTTHASHATVGNTDFAPGFVGGPPLATGFLLISATRDDLACGSCTLVPALAGSFVFVNPAIDSLGSASWNLPIPPNPGLVGAELYAQGGVLDLATPECSLGGVDLAEAVSITIEP